MPECKSLSIFNCLKFGQIGRGGEAGRRGGGKAGGGMTRVEAAAGD